jgi:hypothetical protein
MAPESKGVIKEWNVGDQGDYNEKGCDGNPASRIHGVLAVVRYPMLDECFEFSAHLVLLE